MESWPRLVTKNIKIADLDFCPCDDLAGTQCYYAPEVMDVHTGNGKMQFYDGYKADSWSLGCILLEMVIGYNAFESIWMKAYDGAGRQNPNQLQREQPKALDQIVDHYIPRNEMGDFVKQLLTWDPKKGQL